MEKQTAATTTFKDFATGIEFVSEPIAPPFENASYLNIKDLKKLYTDSYTKNQGQTFGKIKATIESQVPTLPFFTIVTLAKMYQDTNKRATISNTTIWIALDQVLCIFDTAMLQAAATVPAQGNVIAMEFVFAFHMPQDATNVMLALHCKKLHVMGQYAHFDTCKARIDVNGDLTKSTEVMFKEKSKQEVVQCLEPLDRAVVHSRFCAFHHQQQVLHRGSVRPDTQSTGKIVEAIRMYPFVGAKYMWNNNKNCLFMNPTPLPERAKENVFPDATKKKKKNKDSCDLKQLGALEKKYKNSRGMQQVKQQFRQECQTILAHKLSKSLAPEIALAQAEKIAKDLRVPKLGKGMGKRKFVELQDDDELEIGNVSNEEKLTEPASKKIKLH